MNFEKLASNESVAIPLNYLGLYSCDLQKRGAVLYMNVHNHKVTQSMQDSAQCLNKPFKGYLCHMLTDRSFIIRLFRGWGPLEISNELKQKVLRRFFCCSSSVFVRLWFHTWRLCCPYLFLIAPVFGASGGLCFVIMAFPWYLHIYVWLRLFMKMMRHQLSP